MDLDSELDLCMIERVEECWLVGSRLVVKESR